MASCLLFLDYKVNTILYLYYNTSFCLFLFTLNVIYILKETLCIQRQSVSYITNTILQLSVNIFFSSIRLTGKDLLQFVLYVHDHIYKLDFFLVLHPDLEILRSTERKKERKKLALKKKTKSFCKPLRHI